MRPTSRTRRVDVLVVNGGHGERRAFFGLVEDLTADNGRGTPVIDPIGRA